MEFPLAARIATILLASRVAADEAADAKRDGQSGSPFMESW